MELWVDKYSPTSLGEYVFQNDEFETVIRGYLEKGALDNLFLYGPAGVGKSSLFPILMKELGIDNADILELNASKIGNIDTVREEISSFIMSGGWSSNMKYIHLDEADGITPTAQKALKADMEAFSDTVRWFLTANSDRIIPPIKDRCVCVNIKAPDKNAYLEKLAFILETEKIVLTEENLHVLQFVVDKNYPSLRGAIRALQKYCLTGELSYTKEKSISKDLENIYELFSTGKIKTAREKIAGVLSKDEIESVYVWLYNNLHIFKEKDRSIIIINEGLKAHSFVADPEINLSATLVQLTMLNEA